jgi:hypothetical protein
MKQKITIHRMSMAHVFPETHPMAGELTHFSDKMKIAFGCHTGINASTQKYTPFGVILLENDVDIYKVSKLLGL